MPSVFKTWDFSLAADNLPDGGTDANIAVVQDTVEPKIEFDSITKNVTASEFAQRSTTEQTWEDWGVPAGASVSAVSASYTQRTIAVDLLNSHSFSLRIIDSGGTTVLDQDVVEDTALATSIQPTMLAGNGGVESSVSSASQISSTSVRMQVQYDSITNSGGKFDVKWGLGSITLRMDYDPAPAVQPHVRRVILIT